MNDAPHFRLREAGAAGTITAVSNATFQRPIIIVSGMHRSGTSLCSHVLSALGIDMADQVGPLPQGAPAFDNPKGHWERWEIVALHDRILQTLNRAYYSDAHDLAFPAAWWADPRIVEIRREIVAFLEKRMDQGYFGFKDPRTTRLMPLWHQIIGELGLAPKIIFCLRNPAQVARSLNMRDGLSVDIAEARWFYYVIDFFRHTKNSDICVIEYEDWFDETLKNVNKLRNFLDVSWHQTEFDLDITISSLVDAQLRHDDFPDRQAKQPMVRSLYQLARRAADETAARDQIQTMVAQLISFQQLQGGVQRVFEQHALAAARVPALEQEAGALRNVLAERDATLEDLHAKTRSAELGQAEAVAEIERLQARITDVVTERDQASVAVAAREAAYDAAQAAVTELGDRLAQAEQRAQTSEDAAAVAQAEVAELGDRLAQAEQRAQTSEDAAAAAQAEVAELGDRLVQAEQRAQTSEDAAAAAQAEVTELGDRLARAERRVQTGEDAAAAAQVEAVSLSDRLVQAERQSEMHAAAFARVEQDAAMLRDNLRRAARAEEEAEQRVRAMEGLHARIAGLTEDLAAARQVGKSLMDALKILPAPSVAQPSRLRSVVSCLFRRKPEI